VNLARFAPDWLALVFGALLLAAAAEDAVRMRISNILVALLIAAAIAAAALVGFEARLWENLALFLAFLLVGTPLFAAGKLGGGDVKLMAAAALWFNLRSAPTLLLSVALAGGALALLVLAVRSFNWSEATRRKVRVLQAGSGIPYGVAIAAGALVATALQR